MTTEVPESQMPEPKAPEPVIPDQSRPASPAPTELQLEENLPGGSKSAGHDPYSALRLPAFRRYAIGSTLSNMGQQMQAAAIGWEVAIKSAQPALAISMVGLVGALPVILLALPAGHLADSMDRKKVTIITLLLSSICSVGLALLSYRNAPLLPMYGVLLLSATMLAICGPARSALITQIVPMEQFSNAAAWSSSYFQIASMAGPAIAGGIIGIESIGLGLRSFPTLPVVYVIDAACGICFAALLLGIRLRPAERRGEAASLQTLLAGIHFVRLNKIILATITMDLFAVLLGGATYMLPLFAKDVLHVGPKGFGWMRAAPAIGAFGMALLVAHMPPDEKSRSKPAAGGRGVWCGDHRLWSVQVLRAVHSSCCC